MIEIFMKSVVLDILFRPIISISSQPNIFIMKGVKSLKKKSDELDHRSIMRSKKLLRRNGCVDAFRLRKRAQTTWSLHPQRTIPESSY